MLYPGKVIRGGAQMKKVCVISILFLLVGMLFAQTDISNITLMPVKNVLITFLSNLSVREPPMFRY